MSPAIAGLRSPLYVEQQGRGPALVALHGGAGTLDDLTDLRRLLGQGRRVISPEQRGHGRSTGDGEISYAAQAADTAALLDELGVANADILGWSDGGVVALLLAYTRPDLVNRVISISGNVSMTSSPRPLTPEVQASLAAFTPADFEMPDVRRHLPHAEEDWPGVVRSILAMWRDGPALAMADLSQITARVLFLAADRDIIQIEHTVAMYEATPSAELAIVPGADHDFVQARANEVAAIVGGFLARSANPT
jgi:pimeloyl-ACP methyl ester carboxylesterase